MWVFHLPLFLQHLGLENSRGSENATRNAFQTAGKKKWQWGESICQIISQQLPKACPCPQNQEEVTKRKLKKKTTKPSAVKKAARHVRATLPPLDCDQHWHSDWLPPPDTEGGGAKAEVGGASNGGKWGPTGLHFPWVFEPMSAQMAALAGEPVSGGTASQTQAAGAQVKRLHSILRRSLHN